MMPSQSKRNGEIDVLRFIFIVLIILGHIIKGSLLNLNIESKLVADIGVEFFFIVSGYFLCKHYYYVGRYVEIDKYPEHIWKYILKKASYIYIYIIINVVLYIIIRIVFLKENIIVNIFNILMDLPMLLFVNIPLHQTGILYFTGQWFLSAMFVATFIIYTLLMYKKDVFIKVLSPITTIFLYGYMAWKYKTIVSINLKSDFIDGAILRALAGISLGVLAYYVSQKARKSCLNNLGLVILKYILFAIVIWHAIQCNPKYRFSIILLLFFAICISFMNDYTLGSNVITNHLGKLSMIMFICHSNIIYIFHYLNIKYENEKFLVVTIMVLVILVAEIYYLVAKRIAKINFIHVN